MPRAGRPTIDPIERAKADAAPNVNVEAITPEKVAAAKKTTFHKFAEEYIETRADTWRNRKHRDQWPALLRRHGAGRIPSCSSFCARWRRDRAVAECGGHERSRVVLARSREDVLRLAFLDHAPVLHDQDVVRHGADHREIMADEEVRCTRRLAAPMR